MCVLYVLVCTCVIFVCLFVCFCSCFYMFLASPNCSKTINCFARAQVSSIVCEVNRTVFFFINIISV